MNLFEYEGKKILSSYNIPTPNGWLAENFPSSFDKPVVVKAQVLSGGRGKGGGILIANNKDEVRDAIERLSNTKIKGEKVSYIYIEEKIDYDKELYLSFVVDRNLKMPVLIASEHGGVDIEEVSPERILKIPINPLVGLQPYMITKTIQFIKAPKVEMEALIQNLWSLFIQEELTLAEINPLFLTKEGRLIAGDAKITLDDYSKKIEEIELLPRNQDTFEQRISSFGAVGVEMDGEIAVITSGAGLGLATVDLVHSNNGTVRAFIDLGGSVFNDGDSIKKMIAEVEKLKPKKFLFNFYFQLASCLPLTEAIVGALGGKSVPVFVRMKGVDYEKAQHMISQYPNIYSTDSLHDVCKDAVRGD